MKRGLDQMKIFGYDFYNSISEKNRKVKELKREYGHDLRIEWENGMISYKCVQYFEQI